MIFEILTFLLLTYNEPNRGNSKMSWVDFVLKMRNIVTIFEILTFFLLHKTDRKKENSVNFALDRIENRFFKDYTWTIRARELTPKTVWGLWGCSTTLLSWPKLSDDRKWVISAIWGFTVMPSLVGLGRKTMDPLGAPLRSRNLP